MKLTAVNTSSHHSKGSERTIMTVFWIVFALGAAAVFFLIAMFIYTKLAGVTVV